jgi:mannose-1-phosphate guanylyltransferase
MEVAVILAGGIGTRLYPASSADHPKQFLSFDDEGQSLLSRTIERVECDEVYVLTRPEYTDRIKEHASDVTILTEPEGKDTGPALVYAAHCIRELEDDPVLLCLPSDHYVESDSEFQSVTTHAMRIARETERLVTLGIEPTRAATEYGYIKPGEAHGDYHEVAGFYEKPDPGAAARYIYNDFYWNAGVFAWTPDALLTAARETELAPLVEALADNKSPAEVFDAIDPVSIDHAVLEETDSLAMVPADVGWDDLGSWDSLQRVRETDDDGNVTIGDVLAIDTEECVIATDEDSHVSAIGVSNLTIAAYDGRVLVVPTSDTQRVREVVDQLREK